MHAAVHFLFLAYSQINFEPLWEAFFQGAALHQPFSVHVHCVLPRACRQQLAARFLAAMIPNVRTEWCGDIVTAMNALLRAAGAAARNDGEVAAGDVFVFVSSSTIPVKPFGFVHAALVGSTRSGIGISSFCVNPPMQWAVCWQRNQQGSAAAGVAIKHHQWVVLGRAHAARCLEREEEALRGSIRSGNISGRNDATIAPRTFRPFVLAEECSMKGCLGEYWHFHATYGQLAPPGSTGAVGSVTPSSAWLPLERFEGGGLRLPSDFVSKLLGGDANIDTNGVPWDTQGKCWTYVYWGQNAAKSFRVTSERLLADGHVVFDESRLPGTFMRLSRDGLLTLRSSPFLFARKFEDNITSADAAIEHLLLGEYPSGVGQGGLARSESANSHHSGSGDGVRSE